MLTKQLSASSNSHLEPIPIPTSTLLSPFARKVVRAFQPFRVAEGFDRQGERALSLMTIELGDFEAAVLRLVPQRDKGIYNQALQFVVGLEAQVKAMDPSKKKGFEFLSHQQNLMRTLARLKKIIKPYASISTASNRAVSAPVFRSVSTFHSTASSSESVFVELSISDKIKSLTSSNFKTLGAEVVAALVHMVDTKAAPKDVEEFYQAFETQFLMLLPAPSSSEFSAFQGEVREFLDASNRLFSSGVMTEAGKSHLAMNLRVFAYFSGIEAFTPLSDGVLSRAVRALGNAESLQRQAQFAAKAPRYLAPGVAQIPLQTQSVIAETKGRFVSDRAFLVALQQFLNATPDGMPVNRKDEMVSFIANSPGSSKFWFASLVADPIDGQSIPEAPFDLKPNGGDPSPFKPFITVTQHNEGVKLLAARLGMRTKEVTWEFLSPTQASTDFYNAHRSSIAGAAGLCGPLAPKELTKTQRQSVMDLMTYYSMFELKSAQFVVPDYAQVSDGACDLAEGVILPRGKGDLPKVAGEVREANQRTTDQVVVSQSNGEVLLNLNSRAALNTNGERATIFMLSGGIVNAMETASVADERESREEAYAFPMVLGGDEVQAALVVAQKNKLSITMSVHEGRYIWVIPSSVDPTDASPIIRDLRTALYTDKPGTTEKMKRPLIVVVDSGLHSDYHQATVAESLSLPAGCLRVPSFESDHLKAAFPHSYTSMTADLVARLDVLQDYTAGVFKACLGAKKSGVLGATAVTNPDDPLTWAFHCSIYAVSLPPEMMGVAQADSDGRGVFTMNLETFVGHLKAGNVAFNHGTFQLGAILHLIEHGDLDFEALKLSEKVALKDYIVFEGFEIARKPENRKSWNAMVAYVNV